jgi:hypothetical protein
MKKLMVSLILLFGILTSSALAEQKKLAVLIDCDSDTSKIFDLVQGERFKEIPFAQGSMIVQIAAFNGAPVTAEMIMTVNPQTQTYSMIAMFPDNHACIIVPGAKFTPIIPPQGGTSQ